MTRLTITGKGDKRIFAYPLMKVLAVCGKTCIITDDIAYSRMFRAGTGTYELEIKSAKASRKRAGKLYENMEVNIIPDMDSCEELADEKEKAGFDTVLFISDTALPKSDRYLISASLKMDFMGTKVDEFLSLNEDKNITMTVISTIQLPSKQWLANDIHPFTWNEYRLMYPHSVEEHRNLLEFKDKEILTFLARVFAPSIGIKEADFYKAEKHKLK